MRSAFRFLLAAPAALIASTGCLATQSQLHHVATVTDSTIKAEHEQRVVAENALAASDEALRRELGAVRGDVQALRTELQNMRTEFGAKIAMMEDGLKFAMPVNFAFNEDIVRSEDQPLLDRFARVAQKYYPGSRVTVEGFADPAGSVRYNMALSQRRAESVKSYLAQKGVEPSLVTSVGYGKTRLVTPGAWGDQPGAELNRRVVFVIETKSQNAVALAAPEGK